MAGNIVYDTLEFIRDEIAKNIVDRGMYATGKTTASMEIQTRGVLSGVLLGREQFESLEHGTAPNGRNRVSYSFAAVIDEWIKAKGLDLNPFAVAMKIQLEGTRTWRSGGRRDVYTPAIEKGLERLENTIYEQLLDVKEQLI